MAALHEDMTAGLGSRFTGNGEVLFTLAFAVQVGGKICGVTGRSRSGDLRRALRDRTHANARGGAGARSFGS